eukprot:GHRQ01015566.1.p1 GENE.GHRQ01015566.1~~GHRQ01015566.1.p1  ORF type:complete len:154 (+),score=25.30 GHRQ01015566.1:382-843(+)
MADRNTPGLGLARPTQQMACSSPQYSTGTSPLQQARSSNAAEESSVNTDVQPTAKYQHDNAPAISCNCNQRGGPLLLPPLHPINCNVRSIPLLCLLRLPAGTQPTLLFSPLLLEQPPPATLAARILLSLLAHVAACAPSPAVSTPAVVAPEEQ